MTSAWTGRWMSYLAGALSRIVSWLPARRNAPTPTAVTSVDLTGWLSDGRWPVPWQKPSRPSARTALVTMPCHAFSTTGRYVAAGSRPELMPHVMANVNIAVPVVSGPAKSFGLPRLTFQNPSERWTVASFAAIFVSTRSYSPRRLSFAGNAWSTFAMAIAAQPLPRDQNVFVLTYLLSRHHSPSASLNRPLPPATFSV